MVLSFPTYLISCDSITINQARIFIRIAKKKKKRDANCIANLECFSVFKHLGIFLQCYGVRCDNVSTFAIAWSNPVFHTRTNHTKVNYQIQLVTSADQLTNIFTKPSIPRILELQSKLMGLLPITLWERRVGGGVNSGEQDSAKPKALSATSYLSSTVKEPVAKWHTVLEVEAIMIVSINILGSIGITTCYVLV